MADIKFLISVDSRGAVTSVKQLDDAVDKLPKTTKKAAGPPGGFKDLWKKIGAGVAITGGALIAMRKLTQGIGDIIRTGREFEREWANVTTMLNISEEETRQMRSELLRLSPTLGDTTELAKGMYQVLSASIEPAAAIEFLGVAAKSAKAGIAEAEVAVDALTTVINAYGLEADAATEISDIMFQTVKRGKLTYGEMAQALGTIVPVASQVGVKFEDVAAAMATLTRQGIDAQTATMQLRQILMSVLSPTADAVELSKELGFEFNATALQTKGLSGFIKDLMEKTGGNNELLVKFIPNVRALTGVMGLGGEAAAGFAKDIDLMGDASGTTEEAFNKQMKSADFWAETLESIADKAKLAFFEGFIDPMRDSIKTSEELDEKISDLTTTFEKLGGTVSKVGKTVLTPIVGIFESLGWLSDRVEGSLYRLNAAFKGNFDVVFKSAEEIENLRDRLGGLNAGVEFATGAWDGFTGALENAWEWLKNVGKEEEEAAEASGQFGGAIETTTTLMETQLRTVKALVEGFAGYNIKVASMEKILKKAQPTLNKFYETAITKPRDMSKALDLAVTEMEDRVFSYKETWRSAQEEIKISFAEGLFIMLGAAQEWVSQIGAITGQYYTNEMIMIDNLNTKRTQGIEAWYLAQKENIENTIMDEEEKNLALEKLEEDKNEKMGTLSETIEARIAAAKREAAKHDKAIALMGALVNTATAVTRTLASVPFPFNIPLAAMVAALGAIQIAAIRAQPIPLAEGAIFNRPTYLVGEAGQEALTPVTPFITEVKRTIHEEIHRSYGPGSGMPTIIVYIGSEEIKKLAVKAVVKEANLGRVKFPSKVID